MNKQKFISIVENQAITSSEDIKLLQKVADQHPYSQIVHTLLAKGYKQAGSANAKNAIQHAAIYATDRIVLKNIIESKPQNIRTDNPPEAVGKITKQTDSQSSPVKKPQPRKFDMDKPVATDIDQLRQEIFKNLELLKISKESFSATTENPNNVTTKKAESSKKTTSKKEAIPKKTTKKKTTASKAKKTTEKKVEVKKKAQPIKKSKSKATKAAQKDNEALSQKKQVDLIEKFIKSPPKISKAKTKDQAKVKQPDLSESTINFEEDFASENLALILAKQGNKEKAIEIYKKLIWKFPQKKAYFATQIEKL